MRRPRRTSLDPSWFEDGETGRQLGVEDVYFGELDVDAYALIVGHLVDKLPEPDRSSVQMVAMAGMSYEDAADHLEADRPVRPDRKTVWRWCKRGLLQVREWLEEIPWAAELTAGRIPLPDGEVLLDE